MEYIRLNNGTLIPQLGIGVYMINDPAVCKQNVLDALEIGYRHIDTAQIYRNEQYVGNAVKASGIDRRELFLTTKIWPSNYLHCAESIDRSLERLQTDYIDLLLLHRPFENDAAAWNDLEHAAADGKVRAIGLSNYRTPKEWDRVLRNACVTPAVNQVEAHPYEQRTELKKRMAEHNVALEAWYPLGHGSKTLLNEPVIAALSEKHGKTRAQIVLRWHIQQGHIIFPKSLSPRHMQENFELFDFALDEGDMQQISGLDQGRELFHSLPLMDKIMFRFMKV